MSSSLPSPLARVGAALAVSIGLVATSAAVAGAQSTGGRDAVTGRVPASSLRTGTGTGADTSPVPATGTGSLGPLIGKVGVGGPALDSGSAGLRAAGSGELADAGQSVATTVGSVGSLAALGSDGGSATASVASSGLIPGLAYTNATGSIGSGTYTVLGSLTVPEYAIGVGALNLAGGYIAVLAEKQERGTLSRQEIDFWHSVVVGSAEAGGTLEDAVDAAGGRLPEAVDGSIDSVRAAAAEDPTAAGETADEQAGAGGKGGKADTGGKTDRGARDTRAADRATAPHQADARPVDTGRDAAAPRTVATAAGTDATLADTGVDVPRTLAGAVMLVLLGSFALGVARRRS